MQKVSPESVKDRLAPVRDEAGNTVEASADSIVAVNFTARGKTYQALVQLDIYSLREVLAFQKKQGEIDGARRKNEARGNTDEAIARLEAGLASNKDAENAHFTRSALERLYLVRQALPEYDSNEESELKMLEASLDLLEKGLVVWNVPGIEPTRESIMNGDFQIALAASQEIVAHILPTSPEDGQASPPSNETSEDSNSSNISASTETSEDSTSAT